METILSKLGCMAILILTSLPLEIMLSEKKMLL